MRWRREKCFWWTSRIPGLRPSDSHSAFGQSLVVKLYHFVLMQNLLSFASSMASCEPTRLFPEIASKPGRSGRYAYDSEHPLAAHLIGSRRHPHERFRPRLQQIAHALCSSHGPSHARAREQERTASSRLRPSMPDPRGPDDPMEHIYMPARISPQRSPVLRSGAMAPTMLAPSLTTPFLPSDLTVDPCLFAGV